MTYKKLTDTGKKFIKHVVSVQQNKLSGNKTMSGVNFSRYFEVFNIPSNTNVNNFEWKMRRNSMTVDEFSNNLILWYDKYSSIYGLDANILAAQTYIESTYRIWDFSSKINRKTSEPYFPAALGLTQFVPKTIKDNLNALSNDEIDKITYGLTDTYKSEFYEDSLNPDAQLNLPILLQNLIDNPEIMIKLQSYYMNRCAILANGLASSALFGYNRGIGLISNKSYTETINNAKNFGIRKNNSGYYEEGVDYVFKIFSILSDKDNLSGFKGKPQGYYFGYDLGITYEPTDKNVESYFDSFNANAQSKYDS